MKRIFKWVVLVVCLIVCANLPLRTARAVSTTIVISQVYGGGGNSGAPFTHDFIELFNAGTTTVSLSGWSVQYTSATGTGNFGSAANLITPLSGSLAPGRYLLIQEATNAAVGAALPAPDVTDDSPINMSATGGKVALVNSTTPLGCNGGSTPCSPSALASVVDLIGWDGANFFEGTPAPATTNTSSVLRVGGGCTDTDNNGADFVAGPPAPRNSSSAANSCSGPALPVLSISGASSPEGNAGNTQITFTVNLSAPAGASGVSFTINTQPSGANPAGAGDDYASLVNVSGSISAAQQQTQFDVDVIGDATFEPNETLQVVLSNITGATPSMVTATGTIVNDDPSCGARGATRISTIQGANPASGMVGSSIAVEGIVVGDFQGSSRLRGFYLQEEDSDIDGSPNTSEGIFVFDNTFGVDVSPGQIVRVQGTVTEFSSLTEINNVTLVEVCSSGHAVTPTVIHFPLTSTSEWEQYEGMLVTFGQTLTVTDVFGLERFGEVELAANRLLNPTHLALPGGPAMAQENLNDRSRIVLDDANNIQNIFPTLYPQGGLTSSNTLRTGDVISGQQVSIGAFIAVVDEAFSAYRLRPVQPLFFHSRNPRPSSTPAVPGRFHVAAFNVLNYFTTLDAGSNTCGPSQLDCRGANTSEEFSRQRAKIIAAIGELNPDIAGLMELENNPDASLQDLVNGLNTAAGFIKYSFIPTGIIGTDAIKTGFIYQMRRVQPAGSHRILDINDRLNRPAVAQDFAPVGSSWPGERTTIVVNHFKSKGSDCNAVGDPDLGDGQGNCNLTRLRMAQALAGWLATNPTENPAPYWDRNILIIGDLNSYRMEDPIRYLKSAGYSDLVEQFQGVDGYSYVFEGETGYLDHGLANPSLRRRVQGAAEWHINADEPPALDYNVEFKGTGNGMSAAALAAYFAGGPFRSSDHDPLVIGFNPLLGDFNDDGVLDAQDRTALLNPHETFRDPRMDLDEDGTITQNDFHLWQEYFQSWNQGRYR